MKQVSVLLVSGKKEDFEYVYELLSHARFTQFSLEWADSFYAGMRALNRKHYDIALVEDELGLMRGSQFILKARQDEIQVPIILFTCSECWESDEAAFQSGAIYCLVKDRMTSDRLEEIILKELEWKRMSSFLQF